MVQRAFKGSTNFFFLFESWLSSKKADEAAASIGVDFIVMAKTNVKGFCKAKIEVLTKDRPGGSYVVLSSKPVVPGKGRYLLLAKSTIP